MRPVTIARNYAEALFDLGEQTGQTDQYARLLDAVAAAVQASPEVQTILTSPQVPKAEKARILGAALRDAPRPFVLFLQAVVKRGRQALLDEIAREYEALLDIKHNRLRAGVTAGELYDFVCDAFSRIGWEYKAGLVGHSVGAWWHQQEPIFCRGGRQVLEPGMVVALEPYLAHWHCQDLFLVTDGAPTLLSPDFDTSRMLVIDG